jgi:hypothetical protein
MKKENKDEGFLRKAAATQTENMNKKTRQELFFTFLFWCFLQYSQINFYIFKLNSTFKYTIHI